MTLAFDPFREKDFAEGHTGFVEDYHREHNHQALGNRLIVEQ